MHIHILSNQYNSVKKINIIKYLTNKYILVHNSIHINKFNLQIYISKLYINLLCAYDMHLINVLEIYLARYPFLKKTSLIFFCKSYLTKCCF